MDNLSLDNLIIDDPAAGLFRVNRRVFTEPEYLELERARIFEQCWIYAGHESEVAHAGDFRSRRVAGRPIILARGDDGVARVLLNTCTHRGALVCRQKTGNAKTFQCPYHAWTYNNRGELIGVPGDGSYSAAFDRTRMGLHNAPRTESYRGFIFVNFSPTGESLNDYLADAREYLDLVCDQSEMGMRITEGTQAYSIRANWKLLVENSFDGYHGLPTHQRYMNFLAETGIDLRNVMRSTAWQGPRELGNGHAVIEYVGPWGRPIAHWVPSFGDHRKESIAAARAKIERRFGHQRAERICETSRNLHIFPNLVINDIMSINVRTFCPVSPGYMEVN
ncbi:MAG: aromatic ring-hydroxylating oxygenase subunit alpha, partial [Candidatus Binataceae bacterium]